MALVSTAIQFQDKQTLRPKLEEVCRLRGLVEHNDWHNDDPLRQSLRLVRWVKRLPASLVEFVDAPVDVWIPYLNSIPDPAAGQHTVRALLTFAALIHDVGKAETFRRLPDGATRCPGHEAASARLAPILCARFDFTPVETAFICRVVQAHGEPYELFKKQTLLPASQQQEQIRDLTAKHADYVVPLMLLACGDLATSHLASIRPDKYQAVRKFYQSWLRRLASRETRNGSKCTAPCQADVR